MLAALRFLVVLVFLAAALARAETEDTVVLDLGEKYDAEHGDVYKPKKNDKNAQKRKDLLAKSIELHIKDLKDPDPEVRKTAADMLGILSATAAVPDLIEVLNPAHTPPERVNVLIAAHGALVKITAQNFGYKAYDEWNSWWLKNKVEFLKKAETGTDEASKLAAKSANTMGLVLLSQGQLQSAQQQFLDAVNRDPEVPDYRNNCGLALMKQGRYLDAMEYFEETIGLNSDLPQPYINIGRCYSRLGKTIEAQAWYKQAMERDKDGQIWEDFWMIGKEYMKRGEWQLAYEYLDQARAKSEKKRVYNAQLHNDLAITHYGLDEYHSAWKELMNVKQLGFEPNAGFVAKVKKTLLDMGIDPEKEDKEAREQIAKAAEGAAPESAAPDNPVPPENDKK